ncbi:FAD-dependent monooxygenase [Streptomyces sp. NPDC048002]|uniref:FAD-dependent monooxygenase n=1 Tax=Streptomyces sp. NPDC048002 TaxID=3154344 RepID=UPI0033CB0590
MSAVRVACIGAGPGGLMLALLLRRLGGHEVDVFERSPAGATYGFGVVFSRLSLARLRRAAPDVVAALLDRGARWDDVEVRRDGERIRSSGHGFAAVERRALLTALHELAEQAGARLHFGTEADASELLSRYDVVVAADGSGSRTRAAYADRFGATVVPAGGRYAWFGVDRAFDAMTFLFADSAYGPVGAHVYPYGPDRSTFLVELGERTWERAGFIEGHTRPPGWTDGRAMEFCAEVFADDLRGARLLGNGSRWLTFPHLSSSAWSTGRLVGLGDAVHTAHFSVGSGTTMALEDAVELARRLADHGEGDDLGATLAAYEAVRRPIVESVQQAAWASLRMWSHPEEHRALDPATLMLRLLTRTGQSAASVLLQLDPQLAKIGDGVTALPESPVPALVASGAPAAAPDDALVLAPGEPVPTGHEGPLLVAVGDGDDAFTVAGERLRALRAERPGAETGLLVRAPEPTEEAVARTVGSVAGLAAAAPFDLVALAPGEQWPAVDRTARSALAERLTATGARVAYVCRPGELSLGWTHVRSGRADAVWTTEAAWPADAAGPARAAGPAEVAGSSGAVGSADAAGSAQAAGTVEVAGSSGAVGSADAAGSAKAVGSARAARSADVAGPAEATGPVRAAGPARATGPASAAGIVRG